MPSMSVLTMDNGKIVQLGFDFLWVTVSKWINASFFLHCLLLIRIPTAVAESYTSHDGAALAGQREKLEKFNAKFLSDAPSMTTARSSPAPESTGSGSDESARTNCRPQFGPHERPHDFTMTLLPTSTLAITDFDSGKE